MRGGFHTITLGCKLNQFDTAAIEGELVRRGLRREDDPADASVVIVNTCTVTHRADSDARKAIRSIRRKNPACTLMVTGCYAELDPDTLRGMAGIDRVFGNRDKPRVADILDELGVADADGAGAVVLGDTPFPRGGDRGCDAAVGLPGVVHFGERSRAFLKVQQGCRLACSYCIIPTVRGPSRSVALQDLILAASRLFAGGFGEIVLTGVNTGDYGRDLDPRSSLVSLLTALLEVCGPQNRIRLNSLEPLTVTDDVIDLMSRDPRIAPHLQIPLQSGCDAVLGRMRRNYRCATYLERLTALRRALPDAGLGADVIVGFPGESDAEFEQTCRFIAGSPLNYLHVFSWSARPGTPAAALPHRVADSTIRRRSARLRGLGADLGLRFRQGLVGRELDAVILGPGKAGGGLRALTGNFVEVLVSGDAAPRGNLVKVRVTRATPRETSAEIVGGRPRPSTSIPAR